MASYGICSELSITFTQIMDVYLSRGGDVALDKVSAIHGFHLLANQVDI